MHSTLRGATTPYMERYVQYGKKGITENMKKTILIIAFILSTSAVSFGQMCGSIAQVSDTAYTIHYGRSELLSDVYDLIQTYTTPSSPSNGRTTPTHIDNGILFNWCYALEN